MSKKKGAIFFGVCGAILLIILAILIATSFSYIEYDEIGFKKNSLTNIVDRDVVYDSGRYMWGPGHSVVAFKRTYQQLSLDNLYCFTSTGIEVKVTVSLQWRYTKALLPKSYETYGLNVESSVESVAISAIKNNASGWDTEQFFYARDQINEAFSEQVKEAVLRTVSVEVGYVQLLDVSLTNADQSQRYLDAANQIQTNQREQFVQNSTIVRTTTSNLQAGALSQITVIQAKAAATVQVTVETAKAEAKIIEVSARKTALSTLFTSLGLNTSELMLNYLYITSLGSRTDSGLITKFLTNLPINALSLQP